ncbi:MAG: uroporphyrinogen-III synthase [Bacteroidales bacterium]|nr:uroporphyrinogen-III synthase [Bacteroidales bacterium]
MKIKTILVSQPEPKSDKSPYTELADKKGLKIDFRPFIQVEGVPVKDFRQERIDILAHTGVIFTSRTAVDNYFRISEELRLTIPDTMKYFCISEATAYYLQKYIVYRKRKIHYGNGTFADLMEVIKKHKEESFLVPLSDTHKEEIPKKLEQAKIKYTKAIMYRTVSADLSDLSDVNYDMLVFYSPSGIKSLMENFPEFKQNNTKIATFGPKTAKAVKDAGLVVDVPAPTKAAPSMTMAIEQFVTECAKKK